MKENLTWVMWSLFGLAVTAMFPVDSNAVFAIIPAVIGGIAALGSAGIGAASSASANSDARQLEAQALKQWLAINVPSVEEQQLFLEQLRSEGKLSPEMEQVFQQDDSALKSISTDPRLKQAQLEALSGLRQISDNGGMTLSDKANLNKVQGDIAAKERGSREAILQDMRRRGAGGSGMELAAQLSNQQAAASRASEAGLDVAAQAQLRALDSLRQGGTLAGQMQAQDFGQQAQVAGAQDAISKFNTMNRQDVQQRNVAARNDAAAVNLANTQRISDTNTGLRNQQQMHNKSLIQQKFENETQKAAGATKQYNVASDSATKRGQAEAAMWAGIGQGAAEIGTSLAQKKRKPANEEI